MSFFIKKKISHLFTSLSLSALSFIGCANSEEERDGNFLTAGETALARIITPDHYRPSEVRKTLLHESKYPVIAEARANDITFYGPAGMYHSPDYSLDARGIHKDHYAPLRAGTLVHELWHTAQFQLELFGKLPKCPTTNAAGQPDRFAPYRYDLNSISSFSQLCVEQQARMIENYFRRFLHPVPAYLDANNDGMPDSDAKLKEIIEAAFPGIYEKWQTWIADKPLSYRISNSMAGRPESAFPKGTEPEPEEEAVPLCPVYERFLQQH